MLNGVREKLLDGVVKNGYELLPIHWSPRDSAVYARTGFLEPTASGAAKIAAAVSTAASSIATHGRSGKAKRRRSDDE